MNNPWQPWQKNLPTANPAQGISNTQVFDARASTSQTELALREEKKLLGPQAVDFPKHLFIPRDAQSVDIRKNASVTSEVGDPEQLLLRFVCPRDVKAVFTHYAIANDGGATCNNYFFIPKLNGRRIYPFHGDPGSVPDSSMGGYQLSLGVSPDLSNAALIPGYIEIEPGGILEWYVRNLDSAPANMAVRMAGYLIRHGETTSFGG